MAAWETFGRRECILEAMVDFRFEISAIVASGLDGSARCFPIGMNEHRDGILRTTTVPAKMSARTRATAEGFGLQLARRLDLVGLVALEMFVTRTGRVLANEMAHVRTIQVTGPSTPAPPASSSNSCALSADCRWVRWISWRPRAWKT